MTNANSPTAARIPLSFHDVSAANKASPKGRLRLGCLNDMRGSRVALFHRPHAELGRIELMLYIHTHTAAKRSEMVKEPVSTPRRALGASPTGRQAPNADGDGRLAYFQREATLLISATCGEAQPEDMPTADARDYRAEPVIDATNCQIQVLCKTLHQSSSFVRLVYAAAARLEKDSRKRICKEREMERERLPLRHRWAAGMNSKPDAKRTFGTASKQRWDHQADTRA